MPFRHATNEHNVFDRRAIGDLSCRGPQVDRPRGLDMDLDHFNIRTQKLDETVRFYEQIMGLSPGPRPAQPLNGSWLYSGKQAVLHLLESAPSSIATGPLDHIAFACTGLSSLLSRLDGAGIPRIARAIAGTPFVQAQFLDPNGIMVEANFSDELLEETSTPPEIDAHTHLARLSSEPDRSLGTFHGNGVATAYETCGAGPLLLLIHGDEADRKSFEPTIPALARHFTCVTYDQRDTGDTLNPSHSYSAGDLADDAAALIGSLASRAHVWGNSYGGMIAQELALRHPDQVDGLVLGVTFQRGAAKERPGEVASALKGFSRRDPEMQERRRQAAQQFNSEGRAVGIKARTMVLGAMHDQIIDPLSSWKLAREIPNATLTMLGGVGHALTIEAPNQVAHAIIDFLLHR
jgi:pimeloyl-ACP methyl ester carboxylesterase/catechol 2,3-dioxygenase-like lactoylglutathione lyase family enzyme